MLIINNNQMVLVYFSQNLIDDDLVLGSRRASSVHSLLSVVNILKRYRLRRWFFDFS